MLVLTRKLNEQIKIGADITITIVRMKGNTVRIGIDAPKNVRVSRSELLARIAAEAAAECDDEAPTPIKTARAAGAAGDRWATANVDLMSDRECPMETHPLAVGPRSDSLAVRGAGPRQAPLAGLVRRKQAVM
jgi:carbon storage regulator CsrA